MSDTAGSRKGSRDDASVDRLLLEAGLDDDGGLRPVLLELQALAVGQPVPSDAVAALMMPAVTRTAVTAAASSVTAPASSRTVATRHLAVVPATVVPETVVLPEMDAAALAPAAATGQLTATDQLAARRRAKRRITLTTLSVAVSLAAGGAVAVASDQGIRDSIGQVNHAVTSFVSTVGGGPAPAPAETPVPGRASPASLPYGPPGQLSLCRFRPRRNPVPARPPRSRLPPRRAQHRQCPCRTFPYLKTSCRVCRTGR
jgi:hypothetical protein